MIYEIVHHFLTYDLTKPTVCKSRESLSVSERPSLLEKHRDSCASRRTHVVYHLFCIEDGKVRFGTVH